MTKTNKLKKFENLNSKLMLRRACPKDRFAAAGKTRISVMVSKPAFGGQGAT